MKTLRINDIPVLTSGAPVDVATLKIPSKVKRFTIAIGGVEVVAEDASSGSLNGAAFDIFDQPGGAGSKATLSSVPGPSTTGAKSQGNANTTFISKARTLFVRQVSNSANAGSCSFYCVIIPLE